MREQLSLKQVANETSPNSLRLHLRSGFRPGIVYDQDSSDFGGDKKKEEELNKELDSLAKQDGSVRVWRLTSKYEDHVRNALGEEKYQELCQKYSRSVQTNQTASHRHGEWLAYP